MLAVDLQDLAHEVTQNAEERQSPEVQLIFKSLMGLAKTVMHLRG